MVLNVQGWKDPEVKMPVALNQSWTYFIGDPLPQSVPDLGYLSITGDKGGTSARTRTHPPLWSTPSPTLTAPYTGMLGSINQTRYFTPNGTAYHMPFLLPYSSRAKLQTEIKNMKVRKRAAQNTCTRRVRCKHGANHQHDTAAVATHRIGSRLPCNRVGKSKASSRLPSPR